MFFGVGGLRFKSWGVQIRHSVAHRSPLLQHFFGWSCITGAQYAEMGPGNSLIASAKQSEYNKRCNLNFTFIFRAEAFTVPKMPILCRIDKQTRSRRELFTYGPMMRFVGLKKGSHLCAMANLYMFVEMMLYYSMQHFSFLIFLITIITSNRSMWSLEYVTVISTLKAVITVITSNRSMWSMEYITVISTLKAV